MRNKVEFECPYCGTKDWVNIDLKEFELIRCDEEKGGCDKPIIIQQSSYNIHVATVYSALPDGYNNPYELQKELLSHHMARFGAFLLNKSIEAWKAGHHFDYSFHSIIGYFDIEIYLGGWDDKRDPDLRLHDIRMDDLAAIKNAEKAIEEVMQRKEAENV